MTQQRRKCGQECFQKDTDTISHVRSWKKLSDQYQHHPLMSKQFERRISKEILSRDGNSLGGRVGTDTLTWKKVNGIFFFIRIGVAQYYQFIYQ